MRLLVLSDLHNEFTPLKMPVINCDIVALAGDIHLGVHAITWIREQAFSVPVLFVPGNHEYYGQKTSKVQQKWQELIRDTSIHLLDQSEVILGGVRFLGCTLWTDFDLFGAESRKIAMYEAQQWMTDYKRIRMGPEGLYRKLRPLDTLLFHRQSQQFLQEKLQQPFSGRTVVVTHHAPSSRSLPPALAKKTISAALCSDLEAIILQYKPSLWVHGHIHRLLDYQIGDTRVVCNPRGYVPTEPVDDFRVDWVLDV